MINSLTSLRFIFAMMVFGAHCYVIDDFFNAHFFKEGKLLLCTERLYHLV